MVMPTGGDPNANATITLIQQLVSVGISVEPLIVEVINAVQRHMDANNGTFPTPDEVMAEIDTDKAELQGIWDAWTAAHPDPSATPPTPSGPPTT